MESDSYQKIYLDASALPEGRLYDFRHDLYEAWNLPFRVLANYAGPSVIAGIYHDHVPLVDYVDSNCSRGPGPYCRVVIACISANP